MPAPPSFRKVNPGDFPVFYLALTSSTVPLSTVNEYAETYLAQRISTINGVAQVQVFGQQKYAVRVQLDPDALAARGVGINEVQQAVTNANVNLPTGTLYGRDRMFAVQATGQLYDAAAFRPVIVTYPWENDVVALQAEVAAHTETPACRPGDRMAREQAARGREALFVGDGHCTDLGYSILADEVAETVAPLLRR